MPQFLVIVSGKEETVFPFSRSDEALHFAARRRDEGCEEVRVTLLLRRFGDSPSAPTQAPCSAVTVRPPGR